MKNLFVSFNSDKGISNFIIESEVKIESISDIESIEEYIEMRTQFNDITIINFRRME